MPEQKSLNKNTISLICRTTAKEKSRRTAEVFSRAYSYAAAFEKSKPPFLFYLLKKWRGINVKSGG